MKRWFTMKLADNDNECGEIMIYDMIGKDPLTGEGMSAVDFDSELKALGNIKNINLRINSPGGDVVDANAIYTMIKGHPARVTASIDGIAASAASYIAMAADKIVMPDNAFMLIHKPMALKMGTDEDMMAAAADLERMGATFANAYAERSGQTPAAVIALMKEDRLMTASEAKDLGYCDDLSAPVKMAAAFDMKMLPEKARLAMSAAIDAALEPEIAEPEPVASVVEPEIVPEIVPAAIVEPAPVVAAEKTAYGDAEIKKTFELCKMLKKPEMAEALIIAKTPIEQVKDRIIAAMARASDALQIDTTPPTTPAAHLDEWKSLQAKVKAEMGIGKRV